MQILVLGGTRFIGKHIVHALLAEGHRVTILTRGQAPDDLPEGIQRLRGDRNLGAHGCRALQNGHWDACVDISGYTPQQVRPAVETLRSRANHYLFISTVSVYGPEAAGPVTEETPLLAEADEEITEINAETYGPLKVTCERIVRETFGENCTLLRPQIVAGPFDHTGRLPWWINRAQQPGPMPAPGDGTDHLQLVDVRDIARFVVRCLDESRAGTFNMAGHRITWREFLHLLGARNLIWIPKERLQAVDFNQLPLYRADGAPFSGLMHVDNRRALEAGFRLTPLAETIADTRAWCTGRTFDVGLPPELERDLGVGSTQH
jgi:2'-hydroxyisoflavone reductase